MTHTMHVYKSIALGLVLLASTVGCSTTPPPLSLEQARLSYMQARQNPQIATQAPVVLHEAEQTLQRAEQEWKDKKDEEEVQYLAYATERKVEIARANAEQKRAEAEIQKLSEERDRVLLERRSREAEGARQEAQQAKTRAEQLQQELGELKARQTDRGLVVTLSDVLFEVNRADLKPGALRNLYPLVTFLKENPTRQVLIEGHTDGTGSESYNLELSQRRAEAVRDLLIDNGVSPERLSARGYGEAYPIAANTTEAGRQQNRRVQLTILQ
jgi:OmpA-OmpF porin, OOP family